MREVDKKGGVFLLYLEYIYYLYFINLKNRYYDNGKRNKLRINLHRFCW